MSSHVLLKFLNELEKKIRCEPVPSILSMSSNEFNEFDNTEAESSGTILVTVESDNLDATCELSP